MIANSLAADERGTRARESVFCRVESIDGNPIRTASGQLLPADGATTDDVQAAAIWIASSCRPDSAGQTCSASSPVMKSLQLHHRRGRTIATFCTGAFFLARAGLLAGRVATTHWAAARQFQLQFPSIEVRAAELVVEQDNIITGGAVTSYNNVALRLVSRILGPEIADRTARVMLIDINQVAQDLFFNFAASDVAHGDLIVERAQRWMERRLSAPFNAKELSAEVGVSPRTLNRRFRSAVGEAPFQHLQRLRVEVAKQLLQSSRQSVEAVSERVGYADVSSFRQVFRRTTGMSPREFKDRVTSQALG
jgi:transcriptional regulator GlxA family with amidase domain